MTGRKAGQVIKGSFPRSYTVILPSGARGGVWSIRPRWSGMVDGADGGCGRVGRPWMAWSGSGLSGSGPPVMAPARRRGGWLVVQSIPSQILYSYVLYTWVVQSIPWHSPSQIRLCVLFIEWTTHLPPIRGWVQPRVCDIQLAFAANIEYNVFVAVRNATASQLGSLEGTQGPNQHPDLTRYLGAGVACWPVDTGWPNPCPSRQVGTHTHLTGMRHSGGRSDCVEESIVRAVLLCRAVLVLCHL